jgi:hypothetical protein
MKPNSREEKKPTKFVNLSALGIQTLKIIPNSASHLTIKQRAPLLSSQIKLGACKAMCT